MNDNKRKSALTRVSTPTCKISLTVLAGRSSGKRYHVLFDKMTDNAFVLEQIFTVFFLQSFIFQWTKTVGNITLTIVTNTPPSWWRAILHTSKLCYIYCYYVVQVDNLQYVCYYVLLVDSV